MAPSNQRLCCTDYHVAWICPVADVELQPARLMLDEEHATSVYDTHHDKNTYVFGIINGHSIVVATCPQGATGHVNTGSLTGVYVQNLSKIRMAMLFGTGSGIPRLINSKNPLNNIHLGDVIVGWPGDGKPACVDYNRNRSKAEGQFEMIGTMPDPDWRLTNVLSVLIADHELGQTKFGDHLARLPNRSKFAHPGLEPDMLFRAGYHRIGGNRSNSLALECVYNMKQRKPTRAIFWVPVISRESFEQAYRDIGKLLRIPGIADEKADAKQLVKAKLSDEGFGQWLMIVDNANDVSVLFNPLEEGANADRPIEYLPHSCKGSIIFTIRTRELQTSWLRVLKKRLFQEYQHLLQDRKVVDELLEMLTFLALAIAQAAALLEKHKEAEKMHQEALALLREVLENEHPDTLTSMNNIAIALGDQEKCKEAKKIHREALALS
ncbi:hypothetical protein GQ43DRAFT_445853 [Delitschia confertaspora ATCC 74209]|uniref:Tetratricopeptide repeat protein n=1 Tax=Delitschia confertaspora ATCC 74209 TaxID=1513339 RepID=A0A9P4JYR9_9PLEO|nr:hypothetical protein GQ43DRAFT_445853 [Delitschia confertaspora ATCC 74209]